MFLADSTSGIGALGLDGKAFVIQLITFVLAFLVLQKWAFKPILKVLKERRDTIESGVALGEKMKKDQAAFEAKVERLLAEARVEADGIIAEAGENGRAMIREAEDKAKEKAAQVLLDAEERIKQDSMRARKQLENEIVGLISDATEAIIGEKVDSSKDTGLIEAALGKAKA